MIVKVTEFPDRFLYSIDSGKGQFVSRFYFRFVISAIAIASHKLDIPVVIQWTDKRGIFK